MVYDHFLTVHIFFHLSRSDNIQNGAIRAAMFHTTATRLDEVKTVKCPPFAESITEGDVKWEVEVGDSVSEDQVYLADTI